MVGLHVTGEYTCIHEHTCIKHILKVIVNVFLGIVHFMYTSYIHVQHRMWSIGNAIQLIQESQNELPQSGFKPEVHIYLVSSFMLRSSLV